jgi:hypothetical protein
MEAQMYEIFQDRLIKQAQEDHKRLLEQSQYIHFMESAKPYTPKIWDTINLRFGNWLINLGKNMKARSIYTKLSEKHT